MIQYWVRFCAGLLRLANYYAHYQWQPSRSTTPLRTNRTADPNGCGYPFAEWDDSMTVFDQIEEMELNDDTSKYFHRRAAFFAVQGPEFPALASALS